jgi:hypothetical protein
MPKVENTVPECLRPYIAHGVQLQWRASDKNAMGDCPLCGRDDKFYVKLETGEYQCWKCGSTGNTYTFIRWLWEESCQTTKDYSELRNDRGLQQSSTLKEWGICQGLITKEWLVPGYAADGRLMQLYRRAKINKKGEWLWTVKPTPTLGHHLHGINLYEKEKPLIYLCEGIWDGVAWYEAIAHCRETDTGLVSTGNRSRSLLAEANVLAVPGCNVFYAAWLPLFADKIVCLLYDNDHPKTNKRTGKEVPPAGLSAMERVGNLLAESDKPPKDIYYLKWGEPGYETTLTDGTDLRDILQGLYSGENSA